jgi:hypothetical protein
VKPASKNFFWFRLNNAIHINMVFRATGVVEPSLGFNCDT